MLTDWVGDEGIISQFEVRFVNMVRPGDEIICEGQVKERLANALLCLLVAKNQYQQNVVTGQAMIAFK